MIFGKKFIRGQISLEYLLIIVIFFSGFLIIIPSINNIVNEFLSINDYLLLKQMSEKISEQEKLFTFLADDTIKEFVFIPVNEISLKVQDNTFYFSTPKKTIKINLSSKQDFLEKKFVSKFVIIMKKQEGLIKIHFREFD